MVSPLTIEIRGTMISAELAAETRIGHVSLIGQHEVDAVGVVGQVLALDGIGYDGLNRTVAAEGLAERIIAYLVIIDGGVIHGVMATNLPVLSL